MKVHRGTFIVQFEYESLDECLASYRTVELKNGEERIEGFSSLEEAISFGKKESAADTSDDRSGFKVRDSSLKIVANFE